MLLVELLTKRDNIAHEEKRRAGHFIHSSQQDTYRIYRDQKDFVINSFIFPRFSDKDHSLTSNGTHK